MTSWDRKVLRKNSEETSQIQRKQDVEDEIGPKPSGSVRAEVY